MNNHCLYISYEIWSKQLPGDYRIVMAQIEYYNKIGKPECLTNNVLAEELCCSKSKITKILKELKSGGYIKASTKYSDPAMWSKTPERSVRILTIMS